MGEGRVDEEEGGGGVHRHVHSEPPPPGPPRNPNPLPPSFPRPLPNPNPPRTPRRPRTGFISSGLRTQETAPSHRVAPKSKKPTTPHPRQKPPQPLRARTPPSPPPPPGQTQHPNPPKGGRSQGPHRRARRPHPLPRGPRDGHRLRCPSQQGWCCLGVIPRQHHRLRGGPRTPLPLPPRSRNLSATSGGGKKKAKTTTHPSNPQTNPQCNQPQATTTEPPNAVDKENKENKEQQGGDLAKGSHEP